jgi:hypothetical protein
MEGTCRCLPFVRAEVKVKAGTNRPEAATWQEQQVRKMTAGKRELKKDSVVYSIQTQTSGDRISLKWSILGRLLG